MKIKEIDVKSETGCSTSEKQELNGGMRDVAVPVKKSKIQHQKCVKNNTTRKQNQTCLFKKSYQTLEGETKHLC
jgi:hypothetical protein